MQSVNVHGRLINIPTTPTEQQTEITVQQSNPNVTNQPTLASNIMNLFTSSPWMLIALIGGVALFMFSGSGSHPIHHREH